MNDRTSDYVFVSYSHANDIGRLLNAFDEHGYNVVYDRAMSYGEEWDLNARRYISSDLCKGVVLMVSREFLTSKAVLTELEYTSRFGKKHFCILLEGNTLSDLCASISGTLDENKQYIMESIMEILSSEQLFARGDAMDWERIGETFKTWGFTALNAKRDEPLVTRGYTSAIAGEKERLARQQMGYYQFDMQAIGSVLDTFDRDGLCVLDIGCSNGGLTISRFSQDPRIRKVIGVDYNAADIEEACEAAKPYRDKFAFYTLDLESDDVIERLQDILTENGETSVDIVFAALVLLHLQKPKLLLLKLYDIFSSDGKIIVRGSDDGSKLCYPNSELLDEVVERYSKIVTNTDRSNGRKLYGQLYDTGYVGIHMMYSVVDTCEKSRQEKENLFRVGFAFRLKRVDRLIELNPDKAYLKEERAALATALEKLRECFCERNFWYCNTSYIAIAGIQP